jgi:recombination protein RecA
MPPPARQLSLWAPVPPAAARLAARRRPVLVVVPDEAEAAPGTVARPRPVRPLPTPGASPTPAERLPTGFADLDRFLGGGLPRGEVVEIAGGLSSGKATLALGACLAALAAGGRAAWVDPGAGFWPLAALEAGAPADRLVVVRTPDPAAACRAADILLAAAGAVDLVVVDLAGGVPVGEARVTRLHRLAERGGAALLFLSGRPDGGALGALVGLRLRVRRRPDAPDLEVAVVRHKRGPDGRTFVAPLHDPDRLRLDSTV